MATSATTAGSALSFGRHFSVGVGGRDRATVYTTFTKFECDTVTPHLLFLVTGRPTGTTAARVSNSGGRPSGTTTAKGFSVSRHA